MSRKTCSPDNAPRDGFFGRLKNELCYLGTGKTRPSRSLGWSSTTYWYIEKRIKISAGPLSPVRYRVRRRLAASTQSKVLSAPRAGSVEFRWVGQPARKRWPTALPSSSLRARHQYRAQNARLMAGRCRQSKTVASSYGEALSRCLPKLCVCWAISATRAAHRLPSRGVDWTWHTSRMRRTVWTVRLQ